MQDVVLSSTKRPECEERVFTMQAAAMSRLPVKVAVSRYHNVHGIQAVLGGSSSPQQQALVCDELPMDAHVQIWLLACGEGQSGLHPPIWPCPQFGVQLVAT